MKVTIGKYINWIGPYQIAEKILFWKDKDDEVVHSFGTWLGRDKNGDDSWLYKACTWIHSKRNRTIKVRIDEYDTWSMDATLAHIIVPMLKQLKQSKHGAPFVEMEDAPEHMRSTKVDAYHVDDKHFERWDYVLDEMIFAFESKTFDWEDQFWKTEEKFGVVGECDWNARSKYQARISNGFRLFGKYYEGLWD